MLPDALFLHVHMYGIMISVGLLSAFLVLFGFSKIKKIDQKLVDFIFYDGVFSIMFGFLAAALFQAFYNYLENPEDGFHIGSGITFIGGLIGGAALFLGVYAIRRKKLTSRLNDIISLIPCCILVAHGFGRVGCFFAGCCYGKTTDSIFGVKFPRLPYPVLPTQLYEAAFLFLMFGICSYLLLKKDFRYNLPLYFISYGIFRFFIEFLRDDDRGSFIGNISPSQFWAIIMVIIGIALWIVSAKRNRSERQIENET